LQLSKPLYESLPWLYVLGGALLIGVSHQLHSGVLSVLLLLAGLLAVIGGAAIWLRRRDFRATRAEYWANDGPSSVDVDVDGDGAVADEDAAGKGADRAADALRGPEKP
jgi:hypothetical protein